MSSVVQQTRQFNVALRVLRFDVSITKQPEFHKHTSFYSAYNFILLRRRRHTVRGRFNKVIQIIIHFQTVAALAQLIRLLNLSVTGSLKEKEQQQHGGVIW